MLIRCGPFYVNIRSEGLTASNLFMYTACGPLIPVDVVALNVLLRSRKRPGVIGNTTTDRPPLMAYFD